MPIVSHCNRPLTSCHAFRGDGETVRRVEKTRNVVRFFEELAPYDRKSFSGAKLVWNCLAEIPEEERVRVLDAMSGRDVEKLWRISAERYDTEKELSVEMTSASPLADLPEEPGQVVRLEGRAATGLGWMPFQRFTKLLFVERQTSEVFGRIIFSNVPFSDALYPIYFRVVPEQLRIPATGEPTEMQMEYLNAQECGVWMLDRLPDEKWPLPREPALPFPRNVTEYLRPIGPGCYVGSAWSSPRWEFNDVGRKLFTFVMVKIPGAE